MKTASKHDIRSIASGKDGIANIASEKWHQKHCIFLSECVLVWMPCDMWRWLCATLVSVYDVSAACAQCLLHPKCLICQNHNILVTYHLLDWGHWSDVLVDICQRHILRTREKKTYCHNTCSLFAFKWIDTLSSEVRYLHTAMVYISKKLSSVVYKKALFNTTVLNALKICETLISVVYKYCKVEGTFPDKSTWQISFPPLETCTIFTDHVKRWIVISCHNMSRPSAGIFERSIMHHGINPECHPLRCTGVSEILLHLHLTSAGFVVRKCKYKRQHLNAPR